MLTRRELIGRGAVTGAALLTGSLLSRPGKADPDPPVVTPGYVPLLPAGPEIYAFRVGATEAYVIHDGIFVNPGVQPTFAPEGKQSEVRQLLENAYLPTDRVVLSINVLLLKKGREIILVDSGTGTAFGPTSPSGRLISGLAQLGVAPGEVTAVVISHAHADHVGGLLDAQGEPTFQKAKLFIAQAETDFWMGQTQDWSGSRLPAEGRSQAVAAARKYLGGVHSQLHHIAPGGAILPGLTYVPAHGHTPGHQALLIESDGERLLHIADAVHLYALQFAHPEWTMVFDTHPTAAVATRRQLFSTAASTKTRILGYHLPFPGLGHVRSAGRGYEWVAQPWAS